MAPCTLGFTGCHAFAAKPLARLLIIICSDLYTSVLRLLHATAKGGQSMWRSVGNLMHFKRPHDLLDPVKGKTDVLVQPRAAGVAPLLMTQASVLFCALCLCCANEKAKHVSVPCDAGRSHLRPPALYLPSRGRLCKSPGGSILLWMISFSLS